MEFFLTDTEQDQLGRDLHVLEVLGPRLEDLLVPSTPASGTNAGRPAKRGGSRPPVVVHVLDAKIDTGVVLAKLATRLVMTVGRAEVGVPGTNEIAGLAAWLHRHVLLIAAQPWARERALEVARVARRVADLVDPPPPVEAPPPPRQLGPLPPGRMPRGPRRPSTSGWRQRRVAGEVGARGLRVRVVAPGRGGCAPARRAGEQDDDPQVGTRRSRGRAPAGRRHAAVLVVRGARLCAALAAAGRRDHGMSVGTIRGHRARPLATHATIARRLGAVSRRRADTDVGPWPHATATHAAAARIQRALHRHRDATGCDASTWGFHLVCYAALNRRVIPETGARRLSLISRSLA